MVAVVGVSASAQANLLDLIDRLGTNLLTVTPGQTFLGQNEVLPTTAVPMIEHMQQRQSAAPIYQLTNANVYRTPYVPAAQTGGIGVDAAADNLPQRCGHLDGVGPFPRRGQQPLSGGRARRGRRRASSTSTASEATCSCISATPGFRSLGSSSRLVLDSSLDSTVFISLPVAQRLFQLLPNPSEIYVRANVNDVTQVGNLLAPTADPQNSSGVQVSRPSNVLKARAAAKGQFKTLLLGLGAVALLVGAIGIANIMVISVLERRGEIGLRRALGATRRHISSQFLMESALLALLGGVGGLALGAGATEVYALTQHEPFAVPLYVLVAAPVAGLLIGVLAGVYPAAKAARLSPTEALRV